MKLRLIPCLLGAFAAPFIAFAEDDYPWDPEVKWGSDIARFESADQSDPPPPDAVLFIGSSSVRKWKLEVSFLDLVTINRGFGGSTLPDSIHFFDRIVRPYRPRAIVIYAGDNDVNKGVSSAEVVENFLTFAGLVEAELPGTPLIYVAIKPSLKRWELWPEMRAANEAIARHCAGRDGLFFADIAGPMLQPADGTPDPTLFDKDELHLNPAGYEAWAKVLRPLLDEALKVDPCYWESGR